MAQGNPARQFPWVKTTETWHQQRAQWHRESMKHFPCRSCTGSSVTVLTLQPTRGQHAHSGGAEKIHSWYLSVSGQAENFKAAVLLFPVLTEQTQSPSPSFVNRAAGQESGRDGPSDISKMVDWTQEASGSPSPETRDTGSSSRRRWLQWSGCRNTRCGHPGKAELRTDITA